MPFSSTQFSDNVGTVASATVSPANTTLLVGGTQQLTVTARDASGNVLSGRTVFFLSSSPGTATVSTTGLVTSVAIGSVTITATIEGVAATAVITSIAAPGTAGNLLSSNGINWASSALTAAQLGAAVTPGTAGNLLTSNGTTWTSVTPAAGGDPKVLFKCSSWNGSTACIPTADWGAYVRYEITGSVPYWQYYCSQLNFGFDTNLALYCCTHRACGNIQPKSYQSYCNCSAGYDCAGTIPWAFGCSSDYWTACAAAGWQFRINLVGAQCTATEAFYEIETFSNGGGMCCNGIRNSGRLQACCNSNTRCLRSVCFTTASAEAGAPGPGGAITITGFGRLV